LLKVSEVDKWGLMSLISGLNDDDTKQAVLSKVEEMTLDDTIAFVEARETGRNSVKPVAKLTVCMRKKSRKSWKSANPVVEEAMGKIQTLI
jgi:hypothetical protein